MGLDFSIDDFGGAQLDAHRCIECPHCPHCGVVFRWFHETYDHLSSTGHMDVIIWTGKGGQALAAEHSCGCHYCVSALNCVRSQSR